jgi:hypothetical protein
MGGASERISIPSRGPIKRNDLKSKRSQTKKPSIPEIERQNHVFADAENGAMTPSVTQRYAIAMGNATRRRITFTARDPILSPAAVQHKALSIQRKAVASAAISPIYETPISILGSPFGH